MTNTPTNNYILNCAKLSCCFLIRVLSSTSYSAICTIFVFILCNFKYHTERTGRLLTNVCEWVGGWVGVRVLALCHRGTNWLSFDKLVCVGVWGLVGSWVCGCLRACVPFKQREWHVNFIVIFDVIYCQLMKLNSTKEIKIWCTWNTFNTFALASKMIYI